MTSLAELLIWLAWRIAGEDLRLKLSRKISSAQARARIAVPRNRARVFATSDEVRRLFGPLLSNEPALSPETKDLEFSLITTCRDEASSIEEWLDSMLHQHRKPKELVICDGGSSDGTPERIESWKKRAGSNLTFDLVLIRAQGLNIAEGRNAAAAAASCRLLLFADVGCSYDQLWSERILEPFRYDESLEVSMGWYEPLGESGLARGVNRFVIPRLDDVDPKTFLPSGRALAVTREAFERAGCYPEYLSLAGEDTLFDYHLKLNVGEVAFVPEAIARWYPPRGVLSLARMVARYARGDAEAGKLFWSYYLDLLNNAFRVAIELVLAAIAVALSLLCSSVWLGVSAGAIGCSACVRGAKWFSRWRPLAGSGLSVREKALRLVGLLLVVSSQTAGFVRGLLTRASVEKRRMASAENGACVILGDSSPGSEGKGDIVFRELLAYLRKGTWVTFVYGEEGEGKDWEYDHPLLESFRLREFDFKLWWRHRAAFFLEQGMDLKVARYSENPEQQALAERIIAARDEALEVAKPRTAS